MGYMRNLLVFALFKDVLLAFLKPQVSFASLSTPAVMDIRRLRRRSLEIIIHNKYEIVQLGKKGKKEEKTAQ